MNIHTRMRNQRLGLEHSTSPTAIAVHTGFLEGWFLYAILSVAPGLSNAVAAGIATGLASLTVTAAVTGLQYILTPKPPKPENGKQPIKQALPPCIYIMGVVRVAGSLMLWDVGEAGPHAGHLFGVQALAAHACQGNDAGTGFVNYYMGDDVVSLDGDGYVDEVDEVEPDDTRYTGGFVRILPKLAAVPQTADSSLVTAFATSGLWSADHRGDGQVYAVTKFAPTGQEDFFKKFPNGLPKASYVLQGALAWDFRDEDQDPEDESTWEFTKNPMVLLVWYLCFCQFGPQWDYEVAVLPMIERWGEEADICDEPVSLNGGGTEPRYEVNGWATTETDPVAVLNSLLASCDGHLAQHGDGTLVPTVGKFRPELVVTITDEDVVGAEVNFDFNEEDEINRLVPEFTYPETGYTSATTDYFESTADQAVAGRVLSQKADFQWVHSWTQARRLGKREWLRRQEKKHGSLDLKLSAIGAIYARWVEIDAPNMVPELDGAIVENRRAIVSLMRGGFQMEFMKHPDDIDAWTPATDEGQKPPVPPRPAKAPLPIPVVDDVTAVAYAGAVALSVDIDVTGVSYDLYQIAVRYRIADGPGPWVEQRFLGSQFTPVGGTLTVQTNPVPGNQDLEVQAAYISLRGTYSAFAPTTPIDVETIVDPTAPAALVSFGAVGGNGAMTLNYQTANDSHQNRINVYLAPAGVTLNKATHTKVVIMAGGNAIVPTLVYGVPAANAIVDPGFDSPGSWTAATNVSVTGSKAVKVTGSGSPQIYQAQTIANGTVYRWGLDIDATNATGTMAVRLTPDSSVQSPNLTATGANRGKLTGNGTSDRFSIIGGATRSYTVDNARLFAEVAGMAPQGLWDVYAFPANSSDVEGTGAAAVTNVQII